MRLVRLVMNLPSFSAAVMASFVTCGDRQRDGGRQLLLPVARACRPKQHTTRRKLRTD